MTVLTFFKRECRDLWIGTERGFKGLSIVFFIYGFVCFVAWLIIGQLTKSHLEWNVDDPDNEAIAEKLR